MRRRGRKTRVFLGIERNAPDAIAHSQERGVDYLGEVDRRADFDLDHRLRQRNMMTRRRRRRRRRRAKLVARQRRALPQCILPRLHLPQVISLNWNGDGPADSTSSKDVIESADSGGSDNCCWLHGPCTRHVAVGPMP